MVRLEWRAIRDLIKFKRDDQIMFVRFDDAQVEGVFRWSRSLWRKYLYQEEIIAKYELPTSIYIIPYRIPIMIQNSVYGNTVYLAKQQIAFQQLTWNTSIKKQDFLMGFAHRYQFYNDNTTATWLNQKRIPFIVNFSK